MLRRKIASGSVETGGVTGTEDRTENGKAIFQVKSRSGNRADLATLNSDRQREKAEFGFLICTGLPTKAHA